MDESSFKARLVKYCVVPAIFISVPFVLIGMPEKEVGAIVAPLGAIVGIVWWFAVKKEKPSGDTPPDTGWADRVAPYLWEFWTHAF